MIQERVVCTLKRKRFIKGVSIYTEDGWIENGYIEMNGGEIGGLGRMEESPAVSPEWERLDLSGKGLKAIPGFIDLHIHGAGGADVMDATEEALNRIAGTLPREGTTSFLATTITEAPERIERAVMNIGRYVEKGKRVVGNDEGEMEGGRAEILGIHLEGPFLSRKHAGAQPVESILPGDLALFQHWQEISGHLIRLVTLAPEEEGVLSLIRYLHETGVISSIGHTDATLEQVRRGVEAGATHVTHLFNAMRGMHHREPGTAGAALLMNQLMVELIADGIHVHPEVVALTYRMKGKEGITLITDAMRAKCLGNGKYELGGQEVFVADGKATLADGTLAGSVLTMDKGVRNMMRFSGCTLEEAIRMASYNPAKELHLLHRKGSLAVGKDADILLLNEENELVFTFCRGRLAYSLSSVVR